MNPKKSTATASALMLLVLPLAHGADVTLHADGIPVGDYSVTPFSTADGKLDFTESSGDWSFGGAAPNSFGGSGAAGNGNAFDNNDAATMSLIFASDAGLRQLSTRWTRSSAIITGFVSDPVLSVSGGTGTITATYDSGSGTVTLSQPWNAGTIVTFDFANPAASAGQTLNFTFASDIGGAAGYQLAVNTIVYEDSLALSAPVIDTGLDSNTDLIVDTTLPLSVTLTAAVLPNPTYLWEYSVDGNNPFSTVGTDPTLDLLGGTDPDGTYRVTVSNSEGSDTSSTIITNIDDSDGINNQWEIDNFGDYTTYDENSDVDTDDGTLGGTPAPDGRNNFQEWTDGTDPLDPDTDDDGLTDSEEVTEGTNPLLVDSDGDGYGDGYEVNTSSTSPTNGTDSPGVDDGRDSIGITFAGSAGPNPGTNLGPLAFAGAPGFSQKNWNATGSFPNAPATITDSDIATPSAATLVDSSGTATAAGFSIDTNGMFTATNNPEQPVGGLLSGYIYTFGSPNATTDTVIDLTNIPYARYDVIVYYLGVGSGQQGSISNTSIGSNDLGYTHTYPGNAALGDDPVWAFSGDHTSVFDSSEENFPAANYSIFRGLSGTDLQLTLSATNNNPGIGAIQIVADPDSDSDGMGDFYEISVGLDPNNDGTSPVDPKEGANGQFDGDGISNIDEHNNSTDPTLDDTDNDGFTDDVETDIGDWGDLDDTGTDPRIPDGDGDGVLDGAETNSGEFVDAGDAGTDPFSDEDSDFDGYRDSYEVLNGPSDPFDESAPGGPNPNGFAIAFNSASGNGNGPTAEFGPLVFAGAPGVEMKNWNRTFDLINNSADASGDIIDIESPNVGELVDSSGSMIGDSGSGVGVTFTAGHGAWSFQSDPDTPYGRLFGSFIFGRAVDPANDPDASITLSNIPYANYDVYVYIGSETNGRQGTLSSSSAGVTYSFTTAANNAGVFTQTTDTGSGFPDANYAVFSNQTSSTFDVTSTVGDGQTTLGIFGIQVVESSPSVTLSLTNPQKSGSVFTADFTTDTAGTFLLERSTDLMNPWTPIGSSFAQGVGTVQVTDPSAPAGKAFYRVSEQ